MKLKCPTFFRSKGKAMAITLSDDEIFDHESGSVVVEKNPSNRNSVNVLICKKLLISYARLLQRMQ